MKILVACEFSGIVRDAFIAKGHDAISCDIIPSEKSGPHIQDNVLNHLQGWDMIIAFPPCTYLAGSGAQWHYGTDQMWGAIDFTESLYEAPCNKVAIENPVGALSTFFMKPTQYIQPWQFGHTESKKTCLWLYGLPKLIPENIVENHGSRIHRLSSSCKRERSLTYPGIAKAMANQWG
jgi:hypothetical protein